MKKSLFIVIGIYLFSACTQQTMENKSSSGKTEQQHIIANNYSDATFRNGIVKTSAIAYSFYYLTDDASTNVVKVGNRLVFSKSGEAVVKKVDIAKQGDRHAVFILVDKKLDPQGDGYPNPIIIMP